LLAEATGEPDMPYEPVIVKSLTNKEKLLISPALQKTLKLSVIRCL